MQSSTIDVAAERSVTPGCETGVFLQSAGSSLPAQPTLDAVVGHLSREAEIGGYGAADEAAETLRVARADLATLVGGQVHEIALTPSDSVAWVKAWWGWVMGGNVAPGSIVLIDQLTYHSHYAALAQTQSIGGFEIQAMPANGDGTTDLDALQLADNVNSICATMVGTHCGNVNPIAGLGKLAEQAGVPLFLDACQALGQLHLDVGKLGCHVLTGTGRKWLRAPRGTGMLWISAELIDRFAPPGLDAVNAAWTVADGVSIHPGIGRFEEFEVNYAAMVGLATAARQAVEHGTPAIEERVTSLADSLRDGLSDIDRVTVRDTAEQRSAIVTFTMDGVEPTAVVESAARAGIRISSSAAKWAALDMEIKGLDSVVRIAPHYFNTASELQQLLEVVGNHPR
jgi:cysteine desulfurase/selenocysteine lyase